MTPPKACAVCNLPVAMVWGIAIGIGTLAAGVGYLAAEQARLRATLEDTRETVIRIEARMASTSAGSSSNERVASSYDRFQ
jgi:hypothetical protein